MKKYTFFEIFVIAVCWPVKGQDAFPRFSAPLVSGRACRFVVFGDLEAYADDFRRLLGKHGRRSAHADFTLQESRTFPRRRAYYLWNAMFLRRLQPGFDASFHEIVRDHQAMVYSIGLHLLRNAPVAEELAQDVFLQLFENWGSFESRAHVTNWLRRVTTQRSIDYSRRARLRPRSGLESAPEPAGPAHEPDLLVNGHLESLIARLPERARQIVVLRYQEDLEPAEIAKLLGLSVGAVKSNLHRSLAWLRGRMERIGVTR